MHIQTSGEGADAVLIGGAPQPPTHWDPVAERLRERHRVHVVHLPGYGDAPSAATPHDLDDIERQLSARLSDLGVQAPILVGYSSGAYRAFALVARGLLAARGIVALGPISHLDEEGRDARLQLADGVEAGAPLRDAVMPMLFGSRTLESRRDEAARWTDEVLGSTDPDTMRAEFRAIADRDIRPELSRVEVPVRLRVGSDDPNVPAEAARQLEGALPNATLEIIDGRGHSLHLEDVEGTVAAVASLER